MIIKAALLLFRDNSGRKEMLFCKPKGKSYFVFPGGKQEAGETVEETLQRELQEELGTSAKDVKKLGVVEGHTPDGRPLQMHLYTGELLAEPYAQAEIESIVWLSRADTLKQASAMTPITIQKILPYLMKQSLW